MIDRDEIKRRRLALKLTLQEAAQRARFTHRQRWSGIERGERSRLTPDTLAAVARALECKMDDLMRSDGEKDLDRVKVRPTGRPRTERRTGKAKRGGAA